MRALLLRSEAGPAALLLVLCLQLGAGNAQEDTTWEVLTMDLQVQQTVRAGEEVPVTLKVQTQMKECMVIKSYLISSSPLEGPSHNYKFTGCLCDDYPRTFFWDIQSNSTVRIAAVVDIVQELNICPEDRAVVPIKGNRFHTFETLQVLS
ncbi:prolactin-inducible protein [Orycteropus afer afer]|uniref:Prolactin-induced protein n=1 Tax=Orycteropus afer afer TaxID=1230840 RepID=A0A8B7B4E8_ORYAF|nr:prolactin-inducible protein [Orycteropus afer afer]